MHRPLHHSAVLTLAAVTLTLTPIHLAADLWPTSPHAAITSALLGWLLSIAYMLALTNPGIDPHPPQDATPGAAPGTWKAGPGYTYTAAGDVVISLTGSTQHTNMSPVTAEEIAAALTAAAQVARRARIHHADHLTAQKNLEDPVRSRYRER
ncbi:hypothetical protein [Nonomuraea glycinis]|uniref:hypothetical protein n=1 Tax=Nonomuraea glycinis TaxID=2047744 RepID=UPI0033AB1A34